MTLLARTLGALALLWLGSLLPDDSDDYLVGPDKRPTVPTPGVYTLRLHFTELNPPASSERTPS